MHRQISRGPFLRFDSKSRIIIFVWVNDEKMLRAAGSSTDPYAIFRKLLERGNPLDNWRDLLASANAGWE